MKRCSGKVPNRLGLGRLVVLDVRGVDVVEEGDDVVEEHPVARGEEVEVDELRRRPEQPLC